MQLFYLKIHVIYNGQLIRPKRLEFQETMGEIKSLETLSAPSFKKKGELQAW